MPMAKIRAGPYFRIRPTGYAEESQVSTPPEGQTPEYRPRRAETVP